MSTSGDSFRFGTVPILWNNDDVPELTPLFPFERVLDEIRQAGFRGTELGSNYPRNPQILRAALLERGLTLSGAYYCPGLADQGGADRALDAVEPFLEFLEAVGCEYLIAAEPLVAGRAAVAGRVARQVAIPALSEVGFRTLAKALDELGWRCKGRGIRLAFHNHAGTWVETPSELATLMDLTDPQRVGLCLDTGHYTVGGGDAVEAVRRYLPRLSYLHFKDVEPSVLEELRREGFDFFEALRRRLFTELGTGVIDVLAITRTLQEAGWSGWVVSEQDTSYLAPLESASLNRRALDRLFEAEGTSTPGRSSTTSSSSAPGSP